jgi:hypothetical protein
LLRVYYLEYRANELSDKFAEASTGIGSTISNHEATRQTLFRGFASTLQELQAALTDLGQI